MAYSSAYGGQGVVDRTVQCPYKSILRGRLRSFNLRRTSPQRTDDLRRPASQGFEAVFFDRGRRCRGR